jgi:peptide-methionine (S)-S-oxide reductase
MFSISNNEKRNSKNQQSRDEIVGADYKHFVYDRPLRGPFPNNIKKIMLGMGCFWGVERKFWNLKGVCMTAVGYSGGKLENPTYKDVCSSMTGHNEVVVVHYDPKEIMLETVLTTFWEGHDPTQGMRQGNDIGPQYRSGIYAYGRDDYELAVSSREAYETLLRESGFGKVTTEIDEAKEFYYGEDYHQQYLAKNPNGYCGLGGTGVCL